jgi:hypothetical protein
MKKVVSLLLVVFVFALFSASFAQEKTATGQIEISGTASFAMFSESFDGEKLSSGSEFVVYPSVGYFIIPKLELEPKLLMALSSSKPEGGKTSSWLDFGGIFNVAYHFEGAIKGNMVPFVFAGAGMVIHSAKYQGETVENIKNTMILPDAGAGIKYFITEKGVIRAELFYQRLSNASGVEKLTDTNIGLRAGISIFLK